MAKQRADDENARLLSRVRVHPHARKWASLQPDVISAQEAVDVALSNLNAAAETDRRELAKRHLPPIETIADLKHVAKIIEVMGPTDDGNGLTLGNVHEHALAWADRQVILAKLAADAMPDNDKPVGDDDDETPPEWRQFDRWAAEHLTPTQRDHVRALYGGPVDNDALGAMHGRQSGEPSRTFVNKLNSAIRKKLPEGYSIQSDGRRGREGSTHLFGPEKQDQ